MDWQPISTAPKDGTNVVVYARRDSKGVIRRTRRACYINVAHYEKGYGWLTSPGDYTVIPTHWLPLPPPPSADPPQHVQV